MRTGWIVLALVSAPGLAADAPLPLSLKRAVEIATAKDGNTSIRLAGESLEQARLRVLESRATLLPNADAAFSAQSRTQSLSAMGLRFNVVPLAGFSIPTFVGPFSTVDARATASQSIFNFSSIRQYQASKAGFEAARSDSDSTAEQVASVVARAYLAAVKADADVETAQANVALSQAVFKQAANQKAAGTGTGIEITRAQVQLANDRQRQLESEKARRAAHLHLRRYLGISLDTELALTDKLGYVPVDAVTLDQARALALRGRPDYQAQIHREKVARLSASATRMERLPSVSAFGDYGNIGTALGSGLPTRTYGISVKVPLFDGGRRDARRAESESQYRSEQIRSRDLEQQIDLDVRLALDALQSADEEVKVAREGLRLAENELAQARRRYEAGVAVGLEVTDAQTRLERARDNQTTALYGYNVARIDLEQSMGNVRSTLE